MLARNIPPLLIKMFLDNVYFPWHSQGLRQVAYKVNSMDPCNRHLALNLGPVDVWNTSFYHFLPVRALDFNEYRFVLAHPIRGSPYELRHDVVFLTMTNWGTSAKPYVLLDQFITGHLLVHAQRLRLVERAV